MGSGKKEKKKKRKDAGRQPKEGEGVIRSTQVTNVTININRVGYTIRINNDLASVGLMYIKRRSNVHVCK